MSTNLLLRRRALMAANNASGGGGGEDGSDIIYLDVVGDISNTPPYYEGFCTIEVSKPLDYSISTILSLKGSNNSSIWSDFVSMYLPENTFSVEGVVEFELYDYIDESFESNLFVHSFSPINLEYRIIPRRIYVTQDFNHNYFTELGSYLYETNINKIPQSLDSDGLPSEICPIKRMGPIENETLDRWVWYNYDGEILFRDLYTGLIYALNSYGDFYQYN